MSYSAKNEWNSIYSNNVDIAYPPEGLIRIIKGSFPALNFEKKSINKVLDIGCGDGRNFILFAREGWKAYGTEISEVGCETVKKNLSASGIGFEEIKPGFNDCLPFVDEEFDLLVSWNSSYYMSLSKRIEHLDHLKEFSRVLRKDGYLIISIPMHTSFIYKNAEPVNDYPGYVTIVGDPWGIRNGEIMRYFNDEAELVAEISMYFKDISIAKIEMEWFGLKYDWYVTVCKKL